MHQLSDELKTKLKSLTNGSEIDFVLESDLCPPGEVGKRWLVTTGNRLYVVSPNHDGVNVHIDAGIDELTEVHAEPLVGNGCLVANIKGEYIPLIRYSNALGKEFGHAARRL